METKKAKISKARMHETIELRLDKLGEQRKAIAGGMQMLIEVLRKMPSEEADDYEKEIEIKPSHRKEKPSNFNDILPPISEPVIVGTDKNLKIDFPKMELKIPPMPKLNPYFANFQPIETQIPSQAVVNNIMGETVSNQEEKSSQTGSNEISLKPLQGMKPHTEKELLAKPDIKQKKMSFFMRKEKPEVKEDQKQPKKEEKVSSDPNESVLRTSADDLLELVKKFKKISLEEAAKKLNIPIETMQSLIDMLVEEKIFGIEYKFTTPYIYLYSDGTKAKGNDNNLPEGLITKERFYENAKSKKVPYEFIEGMWRKYLQENMKSIKDEFLMKARKKKLSNDEIEGLWNKYLSYL